MSRNADSAVETLFATPPPDPDRTRRLTREAAIALLREGRRPTVAAVRARTRRGSTGAINECLRELFIEAGERLGTEVAGGTWRERLPAPVIAALLRIWEVAGEEARHAAGQHLAARAPVEEADLATPATRAADVAEAPLAREATALRAQVRALQAEVARLKVAAAVRSRSPRRQGTAAARQQRRAGARRLTIRGARKKKGAAGTPRGVKPRRPRHKK